MNRALHFVAATFAILIYAASSTTLLAQDFGSYPPDRYLGGTAKAPNFNGAGAKYKAYRTRIRDGASRGANFAGHYALIEIGCGTSCRFAFAVDLLTGAIGDFPYGGEEQYQMKLHYTRDSRLVRVRWKDTDLEDTCIQQDLLIEGLDWRVLNNRKVPTIGGFCDYD